MKWIGFLFFFSITMAWSQEMNITLPEGDLTGFLTLSKKKKSPLVIIVPGSGPTDRDGNNPQMRNDALLKISEGLAKKHIASLRIDKRGMGKSSIRLDESSLTFDLFVQDLNKWIDKMSKDSRFTSITLAGHSQGSLVAMLAAIDNPKVAAYISLAGAGDNIADILKQQLKMGSGVTYIQAVPVIDSLRAGKKVDVPSSLASLFRPSVQPFLISWMKYDPCDMIKKLDVPILIVNGTTDIQVDESQAQKLHQAQPMSNLVIIQHMNHVLRKITTLDIASQTRTYMDFSAPLHEDLMDSMISFIKKNKKR